MSMTGRISITLIVASTAAVAVDGARLPSCTADPAACTAVLQGPNRDDDTTTRLDRAYEAAFNLDHDDAIALARAAVAADPGSSRTHRTLASMLWQKILFLRGAVTIDHYMSDMSDALRHLPDPPPALEQEFRAELARASELAAARLAREPDDPDARYEAGATYGLEASYTASVEGSLRAAYRTAKRAYDAQEAVLEHNPDHPGANVVVGTYRYLVSKLGLATRWLAYIAGFGGGTERGIGMLEHALASGKANMEAGTALLLIYTREGRHEDAYRLALRLADRYPRNRLLVLEAGTAAARAGMATEAERILTGGLARLGAETRPRVPGEAAIWRYQRAGARLQMNRTADALADLEAALASGPESWWRGRVLVGLGKIDDLEGRRAAAQNRYREAREICESLEDAVCTAEARSLLRRPFAMRGGGLE